MADFEPKSLKRGLLDEIKTHSFENFKQTIDKHYEQEYFHRVLTEVYEEVCLQGVQISNQIKSLIEDHLIKIRLFNKENEKLKSNCTKEVQKRIDYLIFLIGELHNHKQSPDGVFVFISRCIASNIHILKKQLDCTYSVLPWEEIEFCLVAFISGRIRRDSTLIADFVLNREKILNHLNEFVAALRKENPKLSRPKRKFLERERNKENILLIYRQFKGLYEDFEILRDVYSLKRMQRYLRIFLSSDEESQMRQLAAERTLQVIGENLKSTPESPNISPEIAKRLLNVAPEHLKKTLKFLRNTSSYSKVLEKKMFLIKENYDDIDGGFKQIYVEIAKSLHEKFGQLFVGDILKSDKLDQIVSKLKLKYPENILIYHKIHKFSYQGNERTQKICNEIQYLIDTSNFHLKDLRSTDNSEMTLESLIQSYMSGSQKLEDDQRLWDAIKHIEKEMFHLKKVELKSCDNATNAEETLEKICLKIAQTLQSEKDKQHFNRKLAVLKELHFAKAKIVEGKIVSNDEYKEIIKRFSNDTRKDLMDLNPVHDLAEIKATLESVDDVYGRLIHTIASDNIVSLSNYKKILNLLSVPLHLTNSDYLINDYQKQIDSLLDDINNISKISDEELRNISLEMLLLDLLEILVNTYNFSDDTSYLDSPAPLLIGKNLRNYLAHDNPLIDIFPYDTQSSLEIHRNLYKTKTLNFDEAVNYGQSTSFVWQNALETYRKRLAIVENQTAMFETARQGKMETVNECLKKGANLSARDLNGETSLNCAVKSDNVNLFCYFLRECEVNKDVVETLLEGAVEYGSWNIVQYLVDAKKYTRIDEKLLHSAVLNDKNGVIIEYLLKSGLGKVNVIASGTVPLHLAALYDLDATAEILLNHNASISFEDNNGDQPLHSAARSGSWKCAEMFINKGAEISAKNREGYTALHLAAMFGHAAFIDHLLKEGEPSGIVPEDGYISLFLAAMYGHTNTVELLLKHKTPTELDNKPLTPLHAATIFGHKSVVELLVKHGASLVSEDFRSWTPVHYAAFKGWTDLIKPLFKAGLVTNDLHTPLHLAAYSGNVETVKVVLECEKEVLDSVDVFGCTALYLAAFRGNADVVKFLSEAGATANILLRGQSRPPLRFIRFFVPSDLSYCESVNNFLTFSKLFLQKQNYGLHKAVDFISHETLTGMLLGTSGNRSFDARTICRTLETQAALMALKSEYDYFSKKYKILCTALDDGNKRIIKALQDNRVDLDMVNYESKTEAISVVHTVLGNYLSHHNRTFASWFPSEAVHCLHIASLQGHTDVVYDLLKYDIGKHVRDKAVLHAAYFDHSNIIRILIDGGASPHATDDMCLTPLHVAACNGCVLSAQTLVRSCANIHARTKDNTSVLEMAALAEETAILEILLECHDFSFNEKYTAFQTTVENGKERSVQVFLKYGYGGRFKGDELLPPLHSAIFNGRKDVLENLLSHGFNGFDVDDSSSHYLGLSEETEGLVDEVLLKRSTYVNATTARTLTPLTLAIVRGDLDVVRLLLKYGADPKKVNTHGYTEIHVAAVSYDCSTLLMLLLENTRDDLVSCINVKDKNGNTPLLWAVYKKLTTNVEVLVSKGADVNQQNNHQTSPLHCAVHVQSIELVQFLVKHGANLSLKNKNNQTAAEMAFEKCDENENMKAISHYFKSLVD